VGVDKHIIIFPKTVADSKRPVNLSPSNKKLHIVFQLKVKVSTTGLDTTDITPDSNSSLHGIIAEMA
jgi:hypothetical protein